MHESRIRTRAGEPSAESGPGQLEEQVADREFEEFKRALRQLGPRDQNLAAVVKANLVAGQSRADALTALTRSREDLARAGRDEDEDIVLEVMDYLVGWASPHQKL